MDNEWIMPDIDRNASVWVSPTGWKAIRPKHLILGQYTDIADSVTLLCQQGVEIQDYVQIGPGTRILSISTIGGTQGKVTIKRNARIGANCVVMPGVTVGENSVLGALSYLSTDIPDNEMWWGTPAMFRKFVE